MAKSVLIAYEQLDRFGEKRYYWNNYIDFYEQYWGGTASPYSVWFGKEYETFREALSNYLEIDKEEIEDCFFIKDKQGRYYISSISSKINAYLLHSENYIPLHWFLLFKGEGRKFSYTHSGFGALDYDGIYYDTTIDLALERLKEADAIIRKAAQEYRKTHLKLPIFGKLSEIQAGVLELEIWLSGFDPSGYILLDYGDICSFIHPYTMKNELSVKEIWQALPLISEGRIDEAERVLNVVIQKWEDIRRKAAGEIDSFITH